MNGIDVIGHQAQQSLLLRAIEQEKLSHAYLFTGPERIGKRTVALWLAQKLFCTGEEKPCGNCQACRQVLAGTHPDLFLLQPFQGKKSTGIDQVRALQKSLSLKPFSSPYKFAIIDQAESLNREAANALLKVLEEPPAASLLILITAAPAKLLPTIISRVRKLSFSPVPSDEITQTLSGQNFEAEHQESLVSLARGRVGWLHSVLADPGIADEAKEYGELFFKLLTQPLHDRFSIVEEWHKAGVTPDKVLSYLLLWWQDVLFLSHQRSKHLHFSSLRKHLATISRMDSDEAFQYLEVLSSIQEDLQYNMNKRLLLESCVVSMPTLSAL
ncbi:MAG: DNA polymerase III subunit delta' [bacterium]